MTDVPVYTTLSQLKVVPVITIDNEEHALPLADALIAGGLPVAEITFRTPVAARVISLLKKERPALLVGAGTLLTEDDVKRAIDAGASFGVAPGLNPRTVEAALQLGFSFSPGVMTPGELEIAIQYGIPVVKFFPAEAAGGLAMLKSMTGAYGHTGVRFMPTGGITFGKIKEYLLVREVVAVGGTWIAAKDDIQAGNWTSIANNCRLAASLQ